MSTPSPLRVLIVEDDKISRFVLRRILESMEGLEIYEAEDGLKAWEMLNGGLLPQLCFLDFNMPHLNGLDLLKRIRADGRFSGLRVSFCSAVRDRHLIMQAASLQPDNYILKPYARSTIQAQVEKVRGVVRPEDSMESPAAACARLGVDHATYMRKLAALMEEVRTLTVRLPTLLMQLDLDGALAALNRTKLAAQELGIRRIASLAENLSRAFKTAGSLTDVRTDSKAEASMQVQQWLSRSADQLMHMLRDLRSEMLAVEKLTSAAQEGQQDRGAPGDAPKWREQTELDQLLAAVTGALSRGKLLQASSTSKAKLVSTPVRITVQPDDQPAAAGSPPRRLSLAHPFLDGEAAESIENLRRIGELLKLLSLPLDEDTRWMPDEAGRLLDQELTTRNERAVTLVRNVVGPDLKAYLDQQEISIRAKVAALCEQGGANPAAAEKPIQEAIQTIRERLQPAYEGEMITRPTFSPLESGTLSESSEDSRWRSPFALLQASALLLRRMAADPEADIGCRFLSFDQTKWLEAMNVFADPFLNTPDADRATKEIQQLEAIAASPVSMLEKCRLVWGIIHAKAS